MKNKILKITLLLTLLIIGGFFSWKQKHRFLSVLPSKGDLKVLSYTPLQNEIPISQEGVTVMFDRPMIPLSTLDKGKEASIPLILTPATNGSFHWLGTKGFIFKPESGWAPATTYKVTLPKGIRSEDGYALNADVEWEFSTISPRVDSSIDTESILLPEKSTILVRFNMSMNPDDVSHKLILTSEKSASDLDKKLEWLDENHLLQIRFPKNLPWNDTLTLKIPSGTLSAYGEIGTQKEFAKKFTTASKEMKIVRVWNSLNYQDEITLTPDHEVSVPAGSSICYEFSQPIFKKSFEKSFHAENSAPYYYFSYYQIFSVTGDDGKISDLEGYTQACAVFLEKHFTPYSFSIKPEEIKTLSGAPLLEKAHVYKVKTTHANPKIFSNLTKNIISYEGPLKLHYKATNVKTAYARLYRLPDVLDYSENIKNYNLFSDKETFSYDLPLNSKKWTLPLTPDFEINETFLKADYHQTIEISSEPDQSSAFQVDLSQFSEGRPAPGVYLLELYGKEKTGSVVSIIQLTSTGIALKRDADHVALWTTQLESGLPQPAHFRLQAFSSKHELVFSQEGSTDAQGLSTLKLPLLDINRICVTLPETSTISCQSDHEFPDYRYTQNQAPYFFAYVYTDRPIYRPGQKVFFSSFVRQVWESRYLRADPKTPCEVHIKDAVGVDIYTQSECTLGPAGVVSGSIDLPDDNEITRGSYEVTLTVNRKQTFTRVFQVTSYRKPSFKVEIKADQKELVSHDPLKSHVIGSYYFGAPLKKSKARWSLMTSTYIFSPENFSDYNFIDSDLLIAKKNSSEDSQDEESYITEYEYDIVNDSNELHVSEDSHTYDDPRFSEKAISSSTGSSSHFYENNGKKTENISVTLNSEGILDIEHKTDLSSYPTSQILTLEASITDPAHQEVSSSEDFIVHKANFYLGIKPEKWTYGEKESASLQVISLDTQGKPLAKKSFSATLIKRDYSYFEKRNAHGFWELIYEPKDTPLKTVNVKTEDDGKTRLSFDIPSGGYYRVVLKGRDNQQNEIQSATEFYAWGKSYVPWRVDQPETIELVPDKSSYRVGEKAKILIKSLVPMTKAWLTYERGHVLESKIIDLGGQNAPHIEIPVTEGMIPNMYIGVIAHVGRDGLRPPLLFRGETELHIAPETKKLQIALTPDRLAENKDTPSIYKPGETVKVHVETKSPDGKPQKAHIIVSVADESVLKLLNYELPDLIKKFYYYRTNNVRSSSSLISLKAGDGGTGQIKKRRIFKDTAHFEAHLTTNETGTTDFSFKLPDDLTTWVVEAVAITDSKLMSDFDNEKNTNQDLTLSDGTFVGSERIKIMATQPFVLRANLPRFLVWGDEVYGSIIANNRSAQTVKGNLKLNVKGNTQLDKKEIPFELKAFSEASFAVHLTIGDQPFSLSAMAQIENSPDAGDNLEISLPVLDRFDPEIIATSGVTQTGDTETLEIPHTFNDRGGLQVSFKASLSMAITSALKNLIYYPWGCSEQKSAHLLALLISNDLANTLGRDYLDSILPLTSKELGEEKKLEKQIQNLISELSTYQNTDGGIKYWPESYLSDDFSSVQSYWALLLAQQLDYDVDTDVLAQLKIYLTRNVQKENHKTPDVMAHTLWVLSFEEEDSNFPLWVAEELYGQKEKLSINALTFLAMTFKNKNHLVEAKSLEERLINLAQQDPREVHWPESPYFWSSSLKNTAMASTALLELDPQHPFLTKSMTFLFERKKTKNLELSTQDNLSLSWFAYRASKIFQQDKTDFTARATLDQKTIAETTFDERSLLKSFEQDIPMKDLPTLPTSLTIQKSGAGTLYYDAELKYYLKNPPPREEGIIISRNYYALDDMDEKHPLTEFKVGENYKGHITLMTPHELNYVLVEEPLPGGFEAIDMTLSVSSKTSQLQSQQNNQNTDLEAYENSFFYPAYDDVLSLPDYGMDYFFSHQEIRDDSIVWSHEILPAGTYHIRYPVRAAISGNYYMPGAKAFEFYQPEIFGRSRSGNLIIKNDH